MSDKNTNKLQLEAIIKKSSDKANALDATTDAVALESKDQCSICLQEMTDKTTTDGCNHNFCFTCIIRWTKEYDKVNPHCPLCKTSIASLRHNNGEGSETGDVVTLRKINAGDDAPLLDNLGGNNAQLPPATTLIEERVRQFITFIAEQAQEFFADGDELGMFDEEMPDEGDVESDHD